MNFFFLKYDLGPHCLLQRGIVSNPAGNILQHFVTISSGQVNKKKMIRRNETEKQQNQK